MIEAYTAPAPVAPVCPACRAMAPECLVPAEALAGGAGVPLALCWLCAHVVTEHGATLENSVDAIDLCPCRAEAIFPADVLARRRPIIASGEIVYGLERHPPGRVMQISAASSEEIRLHAEATRSTRVRARERQAQAREAASKTAAARLANRVASPGSRRS